MFTAFYNGTPATQLGSSWTPPSQSVWSPAGFPHNVAKNKKRLSNALRVPGGATVAKPTDGNRLDVVGRALLVAVSISKAKIAVFFLRGRSSRG
jgi:hypothetical protein